MTRRITRTAQAETDLAEIVAHIATDSPAAALREADRLEAKGELLLRWPGIGRPYPRRNARLFPVGRYVILYRETASGITILRYFHTRRDPAGL